MIDIIEFAKWVDEFEPELAEYRKTGRIAYLYEFYKAVMTTTTEADLLEFDKYITDFERRALSALIEKIGAEGNISIVKFMQETNLSRPVFTSLFNKLTKYRVAEVTNQGVKGMHIKFLCNIE